MALYGLTDDQLFSFLNVVLPCWVLLMLLPSHKLTQAVVLLASFLMCLQYMLLTLPMLGKGDLDFQAMFTLDGVTKLFKERHMCLIGWTHFAVFDLWTGRWIAMDAVQRQIPRLLIAPILFGTMMLGPVGLGTYFIIRTAFKNRNIKASRPKSD